MARDEKPRRGTKRTMRMNGEKRKKNRHKSIHLQYSRGVESVRLPQLRWIVHVHTILRCMLYIYILRTLRKFSIIQAWCNSLKKNWIFFCAFPQSSFARIFDPGKPGERLLQSTLSQYQMDFFSRGFIELVRDPLCSRGELKKKDVFSDKSFVNS